MNRILILTLVFASSFFTLIASDTLVVNSVTKEATVFLDGAQLLKSGDFALSKGTNIVRFKKLSPYLDDQSIQIKLSNNAVLLSMSAQFDFQEKNILNRNLQKLNADIEALDITIASKTLEYNITNEKLEYLKENRKLMAKTNELKVNEWKEADLFHDQRLTELMQLQADLQKQLDKLRKEKEELLVQVNNQGGSKVLPYKDVFFTIDVSQNTNVNYEFRYFTKGATWVPNYDFKLDEIGQPITGIFKGLVSQQTMEDWTDVQLTLSSGNPTMNNTIPSLQKYVLDYHRKAPTYGYNGVMNNSIESFVLDRDGNPLIGASVIVQGSTVGTITDVNGKFKLTLPSNAERINVSYIGFDATSHDVRNLPNRIILEESGVLLDEVVLVQGSRSNATNYYVDGIRITAAGLSKSKAKKDKNSYEEARIQQNVVKEGVNAFSYVIEKPYSIASGDRPVSVEILKEEISADYQYVSVPKIEAIAFVDAQITDLFSNKVLDGEASLFFENNYLGKTIIESKTVDDTLSLSFGRDRNVIITRELQKSKSKKRFLSNKMEVVKSFEIAIKNRKSVAINLNLKDQIPYSMNNDIKVEIEELTGGQLDELSGMVNWDLKLAANEERKIVLSYKVTYPKNNRLVIE